MLYEYGDFVTYGMILGSEWGSKTILESSWPRIMRFDTMK